ncbi:Uncharacterized protein At4g02000 [Linum perenne]
MVLFRFYHARDVQWVIDNGPWTFDGSLLVLHELKQGEHPANVALKTTDFWVQVHNLPNGFFSTLVVKALGNYIGEFVKYDERGTLGSADLVLRIRVRLDIREPLRREKTLKRPNGELALAKFRYEKLSTFCFICGRLGHIDRHCEIYFRLPDDQIIRMWDISLRAPPRRGNNLGGDKWLVEDAIESGDTNVLRERSLNLGQQPPRLKSNFIVNLGATKFTKDLTFGNAKEGVESSSVVMVVQDDRKRPRQTNSHSLASEAMDVDARAAAIAGGGIFGIQEPSNLASAGLQISRPCPEQ